MHELSWHIDNKVILLHIQSELKIEDLSILDKQIKAMLDAGNAPVHLIYQSEDVDTPKDIAQVAKRLTFLKHQNCSWIITLGSNILITFIGRVVTNLSHIKLKAVPNIEEADKFLSKFDTNIVASTS